MDRRPVFYISSLWIFAFLARNAHAASSFDLLSENAAALAARIIMRSEQGAADVADGDSDKHGGINTQKGEDAETRPTQSSAGGNDGSLAESLEIGAGFKASPVGTCKHKIGSGKIRMSGKSCRNMGGTIFSTVADSASYDCPLDFCRDGKYSAASVGKCTLKAGHGVIKMHAKDCRGMGGSLDGDPKDHEWTDCSLDWCEDGTFSAMNIGQCQVKRGFGQILMKAGNCDAMGGLKEQSVSGDTYVHCSFDWCFTTDCLYRDWTEWGTCSATCDGGFHMRSRGVLVEAMYGGKQCASHQQMKKTVEEKSCGNEQICWGSPCEDHPPNWADPDGATCNVYEWGELCGHYRTDGPGWHVKGKGRSFKDYRGTSDLTATQACCACGGGRIPASEKKET